MLSLCLCFIFGGGGWIRTSDLRVIGSTSFDHCTLFNKMMLCVRLPVLYVLVMKQNCILSQ